jgi:RimJ/RimL family protein N-acetyltransferase
MYYFNGNIVIGKEEIGMLSKVVFVLNKWNGIDWQMRLAELLEDLGRHGVAWRLENPAADSGGTYRLCENVVPECGQPQDEILYIADLSAVCKTLTAKGCYVLPYRHEQNRCEMFHSDRYFYIVERLEEMDSESLDRAYRRLAGLPWEILNTKRCIVRETTVEDVDAFYQIYGSPEITQYIDSLCAVREEETAYIEDYIRKVYYFYGYGMWTVVERESGCVIGRAGISWREGYELPELGFLIGIPWQGRGYAYEVCRAILTYAKEELEITQVQTLVMKENEKSVNLVKKLGFVRRRGVTLPDGRRADLFTREETCDRIGLE